jgi:predicted peptidase
MRKRLIALLSAAAIAGTVSTAAQTQAPPAAQTPPAASAEPNGRGFGPPALSSEELAKQPQTPGAKGDQQRHYRFAAARVEMPYRLYVPSTYDPAVGAPLVVALHGHGGDQNYFFSVEGLAALCERYGFIYLAPMAHSRDGWYGAPLSIPGNAPRSSGAPPPPQVRTPEEEIEYRALSETDVMNTIDLVRKEYKIDPDRIYLMGHSMGGFGTWWLGQKYVDMWAAIAPMSGVLPDIDYQLPKFAKAKVAVHVSIGGAENPAWVEASKKEVEKMKAMGMTVTYFEPAGASHQSMIRPTVPQVLEFFSTQKKRK